MIRLIYLAAILLLTASCGTLFGGKTQSVTLLSMNSNNDLKADVSTSQGVQKSVYIPGTIQVKRSNEDIAINIRETECYKPSQTFVESKINLFSALNLLSVYSSTSSTTTDYVTGGLWSYDKTVYVSSRKKSNKNCD